MMSAGSRFWWASQADRARVQVMQNDPKAPIAPMRGSSRSLDATARKTEYAVVKAISTVNGTWKYSVQRRRYRWMAGGLHVRRGSGWWG